MKAISLHELRRYVANDGIAATSEHLVECLEQGTIKPHELSVRDLFLTLHEDGDELFRSIAYGKSGGRSLTEAASAVDTSAFSNLTGPQIFNRIKEKYEDPEFLWPQLCETIQTPFLDGEKIPGIGRIGDKAEVVDEAALYPTVGLNEEWIMTGRTIKRGFIVPVTREIIIADRTGLLLKTAGEVGRWLGLNKEKRILDVVVGGVNNYNRNNVSTNTYLTSGAYINDQTGNALDGQANEWRALEKADLLFDAITDPNTGEPILVVPNTLLVPSALKRTANRIIGATEVQTVDMRANATTIRTTGGNPYAGAGLKVLSSPYVKLRVQAGITAGTISGAAVSNWYYGRPERAFAYMEVWAIEPITAPNNSEPEFTQDIWIRHKVSERGFAQAWNLAS